LIIYKLAISTGRVLADFGTKQRTKFTLLTKQILTERALRAFLSVSTDRTQAQIRAGLNEL